MAQSNTTYNAPHDTSSPGASFDFKLYRYDPSLAAAIIAVIAFGVLTCLHAWRIRRAKALYFMPFTVGGLFEAIGYCGRIWSHFNKTAIGGFVMQAILILVAPALFAASIYMILGRLIRTLRAEHLFFIPVKRVTRIFVTGDVVSFALQAGGGGIQASGTLDLFNTGEKIIVAGLFVQLLFFGFFIVATGMFHHRLAHAPTAVARHGTVPWQRHLRVLYSTSTLILVRSIFRVVEYLQGNDSYIIGHEVFLYIFDMLLMVSVMVLFLIWYVDDLEFQRGSKAKHSHLSSSSDGVLQELEFRPHDGHSAK